MKTLKINNKKIITENFHGISFIHQLYEYMPDNEHRELTDEQIATEIATLKKMGVKHVRSFFGGSLTWDEANQRHNFESAHAMAFYKACKLFEEAGIEVGITPQWDLRGFLTEPSEELKQKNTVSLFHSGCYVKDDIDATAKNFEKFIEDMANAFERHNVTNVKHLFCFTECNNTFIKWNDGTNKSARERREYDKVCELFDKFVSAVDRGLKNAGKRENYKIVGPCDNWRADDGSEPYSILVKYCADRLADKIDIIGSHNGYDRSSSWTDTDFYDLPEWKLSDPRNRAKSLGKEYYVDEFNVALHSAWSWGRYNATRNDPMRGVAFGALTNKIMNMGYIHTMYVWALYDQQWPDHSSFGGLDPNKGEFYQGVQMVGYLFNLRQTTLPQYPWYAVAMLSRHLGEGNVFEGDRKGNTYVSAMEKENGETTVVLTNYDDIQTEVEINFEKSFEGKTFYKYIYDPKTVKPTTEIEMIKCSEEKSNINETIKDTLPGYAVVVYTTEKPE